jgi:hypothetical protein
MSDKSEASTPSIRVLSAEALTPDSLAIIEAGKQIFSDSLETGRDTCKFLVTLSASAIPIYIAIFRLIAGDHAPLTKVGTAVVAGPLVLFLLAIIFGASALRPTHERIRLNVLEDITDYRDRLLKTRRSAATKSFWLFIAGMVLAVVTNLIGLDAVGL